MLLVVHYYGDGPTQSYVSHHEGDGPPTQIIRRADGRARLLRLRNCLDCSFRAPEYKRYYGPCNYCDTKGHIWEEVEKA